MKKTNTSRCCGVNIISENICGKCFKKLSLFYFPDCPLCKKESYSGRICENCLYVSDCKNLDKLLRVKK